MIYHDIVRGTERFASVHEHPNGNRVTSISLNATDVRQLLEMTPERLKEWLGEVASYLRPTA